MTIRNRIDILKRKLNIATKWISVETSLEKRKSPLTQQQVINAINNRINNESKKENSPL